jgi:DNA-binding NtrC family response regulator
MTPGQVLFVLGEGNKANGLHAFLNALPVQVETASGVTAARGILSAREFHAIVLHAGSTEDEANGTLRFLTDYQDETPIVVLAEQISPVLVDKYHAAGAFDLMVRPVDKHALVAVLRRALLRNGLAFALDDPPRCAATEPVPHFPFLVGTSKPMMDVLRRIAKVASSETNVCVYGESGTGKELVARAIHYSSRRAVGPLIVFDCTAVPDGLMESEMFGHTRGAFTSAVAERDGVFQMAEGGSLFLDEVGELNLPLQAKLLRVVQCREFRKVGGKESIKADVRIIAATNKNLADMVDAGTFREDLLFRLDVLSIVLPPLRRRKEDIPVLVDHVVQRFNRQNQKQVRSVDPQAMAALLRHDWPGNVRELENCLERAAVMSESDVIGQDDIAHSLRRVRRTDTSDPSSTDSALPFSLKDVEREAIFRALRSVGGDKAHAAKLLGISLRTLYYKLKEFADRGSDNTAEMAPEEVRLLEAAGSH